MNVLMNREDMQIAADSNYADMEEETNEIVYDTIVHGGKSATTVGLSSLLLHSKIPPSFLAT